MVWSREHCEAFLDSIEGERAPTQGLLAVNGAPEPAAVTGDVPADVAERLRVWAAPTDVQPQAGTAPADS